jgi:hypothetical protein
MKPHEVEHLHREIESLRVRLEHRENIISRLVDEKVMLQGHVRAVHEFHRGLT